jgi:hypothetical protein
MNKPIIEIIAVTYGHGFKLKCFIDSIRSQTSSNWRLHIIHDGVGEIFDNLKEDLSNNGYLNDSRIVLSATATRTNNWGHPLREYGLQNRISNAPYITLTNCDNYYVPIWVSEINLLANQDKDFIYWDCVHDHRNSNFDRTCGYGLLNSQLKSCWIDMGGAAVKSNVATKVGFPFRNFAADWKFFEACLKHISPDKIQKIPKILFVHN